MTSAPLVSILMTCYNQEKFIAFAIESLQASSYRDWELIVTDDRSTDDSVAIVKRFADNDARISIYVNEINLGDYPNRNRAASYATGKYIKYLDADDYIYPLGLELMVKSLEQYPDAGWAMCSIKPDKSRPYPFKLLPSEIFVHQNFINSLFHNPPLCAIIKKTVFDEVGGFSGKRQISDTEMWHILGLKYPMVLLPHGLVWYRIHEAQESAQIRNDLSVRISYAVARYHFYLNYAGVPIEETKRLQVIKKMRRNFVKYIAINIAKGKLKSAYIIFSMIFKHDHDFRIIN